MVKYLIICATVALCLVASCHAEEAPKKLDVPLAEFAGSYKFEKDDGNFESLLKETGKCEAMIVPN